MFLKFGSFSFCRQFQVPPSPSPTVVSQKRLLPSLAMEFASPCRTDVKFWRGGLAKDIPAANTDEDGGNPETRQDYWESRVEMVEVRAKEPVCFTKDASIVVRLLFFSLVRRPHAPPCFG